MRLAVETASGLVRSQLRRLKSSSGDSILNLLLVGLNHRTAGLETRELASFDESGLPEALRRLAGRPGVEEVIIFSTCNRVELLARVEKKPEGLETLESFLSETSSLTGEHLSRKLYRYHDDQAIRHVFRVASSLDSMILGEPQILGQLKSFYSIAVEAGTTGTYLNGLLQAAFHAAKRVRSETSIGDYAVSVSSAAVDLARKILGELRKAAILIVGAGKMGELAVRHLAGAGAKLIRVANRSPAAAHDLAQKFRGEAVPFDNLMKWISLSDVVLTSTGSPEILIARPMAEEVMMQRKNEPIVFIDISVPRNVDPRVGTIDNVFYYNVDDLGAVVDANLQERRKEAVLAEKIVEQEVESFCARLRSLDRSPVVAQLQRRIEEICQAELERYLKRSGPRSEKELQELEWMVSRIAGKIAHPLITQMKSLSHDSLHDEAYLDTIRRIFKLQKNSET
jgi:glutamyl-tRNA reductase